MLTPESKKLLSATIRELRARLIQELRDEAAARYRLSVPVEFNTLAKIQGSLGTWQLLASAARYAVDNNLYLNEAMGWADRSLALDRNPRNMQVKAELLAKAGKTADAIALGEEAIKMAKAKDAAANTSQLEALVAGWKKK